MNVTLFLVTGPGDTSMEEDMRRQVFGSKWGPMKNLPHDHIDSVDAKKSADLSGEMIE